MKIPRYAKNVEQAVVSGPRKSIQSSMSAGLAIANAGQTIAGIGQSYGQKEINDKRSIKQVKDRLAKAKEEVEQARLRDKFEGELGVSIEQYNNNLAVRSDDPLKWGESSDKSLSETQNVLNDILSSEEYTSRPDLHEDLVMNAQFSLQKTRSQAQRKGAEKLHNTALAANKTLYNRYIAMGDSDGAKEVIQRNSGITYTPQEADNLIKGVDVRIEHNEAIAQTALDPSQVIKDVNAQVSGKRVTYNYMDPDDLRSIKAYAKQELTKKQSETIDELYKPESEYAKMNANTKLEYLQDKVDLGQITGKAYNAEVKRVKEPAVSEMTPALNSKYLEVQSKIYQSSGDPEKMVETLNELSATQMPMNLRNALYGEARAVEDPNSTFNQTASKLGRELISSSYSRSKDDFASASKPKWFGLTGIKGFTEETRSDMLARAEVEAQSEMSLWMHSQSDAPSSAEIHRKTYEIIQETNKRYSVSQMPARMSEVQMEGFDNDPVMEPQAMSADNIQGSEELLSMEDFVIDFSSEEGREPTQEEIDSLKGKAWN